MIGASHKTLRAISYADQKSEEIIDAVTTPLGSRVYEKEYGSELYLFVDNPMLHKRQYVAAIGAAITRNIRDYKVKKIIVSQGISGKVEITIVGAIPSIKNGNHKTIIPSKYLGAKRG